MQTAHLKYPDESNPDLVAALIPDTVAEAVIAAGFTEDDAADLAAASNIPERTWVAAIRLARRRVPCEFVNRS